MPLGAVVEALRESVQQRRDLLARLALDARHHLLRFVSLEQAIEQVAAEKPEQIRQNAADAQAALIQLDRP